MLLLMRRTAGLLQTSLDVADAVLLLHLEGLSHDPLTSDEDAERARINLPRCLLLRLVLFIAGAHQHRAPQNRRRYPPHARHQNHYFSPRLVPLRSSPSAITRAATISSTVFPPVSCRNDAFR